MPWYFWISLAQTIQCFLILLKRLMIYFNECSLLVCTFLTFKFTYCTVHISLHVIASHVVFILGEKIDCISVVFVSTLWSIQFDAHQSASASQATILPFHSLYFYPFFDYSCLLPCNY